MVEWTNDEILHFMECYQAEPCIWDPQNENHKDRKKVSDAWARISEIVKKPVKELKIKKEILMVSFRKHLKKKLDSIREGIEPIYEPVWFAYPTMERFLLPVYADKNNVILEMQSPMTLQETTEDLTNENEVVESVPSVKKDNNNDTSASTSQTSSSSKYDSRRRPGPDLAEKKTTAEISRFTDGFNHHLECLPPPDEDDECDIYACLLAKKLRELPDDERKIFMYEIDGLFVERIYKKRCASGAPYP